MREDIQPNINDEYEKLIPPTKRKTLFDDSEDYEILRNYIIEQPYISVKKRLPFNDIKITSYIEYLRMETIEKEIANGKHIFYLRQSQKGFPDFCDAAGFFRKLTKTFTLLPYSYIVNTPLGIVPDGYSRKGDKDGSNLYTLSYMVFKSPSEAASYVLGQKAGLQEWIDSRGQGLLTYYKELSQHSTSIELHLFDDGNQLPNETISSLLTRESCKNLDINTATHFFYINKNSEDGNMCEAKGRYDKTTRKFILLSGSRWSQEVTKTYKYSAAEIMRRNYIKSHCKQLHGSIIQKNDILFDSPSLAASFVIGDNVNGLEEWVDEYGNSLENVYGKS